MNIMVKSRGRQTIFNPVHHLFLSEHIHCSFLLGMAAFMLKQPVMQLQQRAYGTESLKQLLSGPLQKRACPYKSTNQSHTAWRLAPSPGNSVNMGNLPSLGLIFLNRNKDKKNLPYKAALRIECINIYKVLRKAQANMSISLHIFVCLHVCYYHHH